MTKSELSSENQVLRSALHGIYRQIAEVLDIEDSEVIESFEEDDDE